MIIVLWFSTIRRLGIRKPIYLKRSVLRGRWAICISVYECADCACRCSRWFEVFGPWFRNLCNIRYPLQPCAPLEEPQETQSEFTENEIGLNTGYRLARAIRISADDHKTITRKIRGKLDDARNRIKQFLFAQRYQINRTPQLIEMRLLGSDPVVHHNSNVTKF